MKCKNYNEYHEKIWDLMKRLATCHPLIPTKESLREQHLIECEMEELIRDNPEYEKRFNEDININESNLM